MVDLIDIQNQIDKLQKQADSIKSREFDKTVQEILAKMGAFGITVKDLQASASKPSAKPSTKSTAKKPAAEGKKTVGKSKSPRSGIPVPAKYKGPNGEAWSGRGLMPRWLAGLVAAGQPKEAFAIQGV